jgi:hypothetical protein
MINENAANIVENFAYQVAQRHGGIITVNHLAPYLPLSLDLIRSCLDNMTDGHSVIHREEEGFPVYEFTGSGEEKEEKGTDLVQCCLSCSASLAPGEEMLCKECQGSLEKEMNRLAESTGWPAKAVYEHEVLYIAAKTRRPQPAAHLAGHSRYTLKRMQKKLKAMALEHYLKIDLNSDAETLLYEFPQITYPKDFYNKNIAIIRRYPASIAEDMELKMIRIILCLAVMLLAVFVLALMRVPLPILIGCFVVAAPIVALKIWRHRDKPPDE